VFVILVNVSRNVAHARVSRTRVTPSRRDIAPRNVIERSCVARRGMRAFHAMFAAAYRRRVSRLDATCRRVNAAPSSRTLTPHASTPLLSLSYLGAHRRAALIARRVTRGIIVTLVRVA